jgi:tetratricopeptide (TPR) repeat protein
VRRALLILLAACGVRAPSPIDVPSLLAHRGPIEARRDLVIRVLADPKDIAAHLALASLDEKTRPSEAVDHLLFVEIHGGPLGPLWHDSDRARLSRLLSARGHERVQRGAPSGLADLQHAITLGAPIPRSDLDTATKAAAISQLRHVDPDERRRARAHLSAPIDPTARGNFGAWAWTVGARREAYEQLAAWHASSAPRDPTLELAYLRALAWWQPADVAPPPDAGPTRCFFASAGCAPPAEDPPPSSLPPPPSAQPRAWAATRYALSRTSSSRLDLYSVAAAYARDPSISDSRALDFISAAPDAASAHATVAALFDALGDPARARTHWQAAVDASPEPAFLWGLAESAARSNDGPAALIHATAAAAAWGDPAVVWSSVARALEERGLHVDALTAARSALDLGDVETLSSALDTAISASLALGRPTQDLTHQRARLPQDPDLAEALAAIHALPNAVTLARAWVISRSHPRDADLRAAMFSALPPDDPRRPTILDELLSLSGDPDPSRSLTAARALR